MSVATKNPFAILDAEDNSRPTSPAPAKSISTPQPAAAAAANDSAKSKGGPASRGGKYYQRGGGNKSVPRESGGNLNQNGVEEPVGKKYDGRGRGRGGRGRGGARGGGRPFDKHSQTGKTDSDKKIHQSWGGDDGNAEFKVEEAAGQDVAAETTNEWATDNADAADAWGAPPEANTDTPAAAVPAEGDKPERRRREREPEEEDNTLTLDEYQAQQKEKESSLLPKLEGRKIEDSSWKDVVPLEKTSDDAYFAGKGKAAPKARAKKEEKVFLEIDARFERPARGGPRGRGERGGGGGGGRGGGERGRGGRGIRGRGGPPVAAAVDVDDQTAFPSLS